MAEFNLLCNDCGYKFKPKGDQDIPDICPYCGKHGSVDKADSAEDLLKKYGDV